MILNKQLFSPKKFGQSDRRIIDGFNLRNPRSISASKLPSFQTSKVNSIRNNSSIMRNSQNQSILKLSRVSIRSDHQLINQSPPKLIKTAQLQTQQLLEKYYDKNYIKNLITYHDRKWEQQIDNLLQNKRYNTVVKVIMERTAQFNPILQDLLVLQYDKFSEKEKKLLVSIHFKQYIKILKDFQNITKAALSIIPDQKMMKHQEELFQLFKNVLNMFDPKYANNAENIKQKLNLYFEAFTEKKSQMLGKINQQLKPMFDVLDQVEKHFLLYQKQLIKLQNQNKLLQREKEKTKELLQKKILYTPIEVDYLKIKQIKQKNKAEIFKDLETNIIKYYQQSINTLNQKLNYCQLKIIQLENIIQEKNDIISNLKVDINKILNSKPTMVNAETQLFYLASKKVENSKTLNFRQQFLQNVASPFVFSVPATHNIISLFLSDKVIYDYQSIRAKSELKSVKQFLFQWMIVKSGDKKVAQILCKNFILSVLQLRRINKRCALMTKFFSLTKLKKKNIIEDLDLIFFDTHLAWYYFLKLSLAYRRKLIDNPAGLPLIPPTSCDQVSKISLRRCYQLVQQFLQSEGFQIPENLHSKLDLYAINEISKFKKHDQQFQKEQMQEIHILKDINFDIITGFTIEYVSNLKCEAVQKLLRAIQIKQKQLKIPLSYKDFQFIYKKFYKEKRAKIQLVYAKFCLANQNNILDMENMMQVVKLLLQDEGKLRVAFETVDSLKLLVFSDRATQKWQEKRKSHPNTFQNVRQRYYQDYYDHFNSTSLITELYNSIKHLIRKHIFNESGKQTNVDFQQKQMNFASELQLKQDSRTNRKSADDSQNQKEQIESLQKSKQNLFKLEISQLQKKFDEFQINYYKIPKFPKRIFTLQQLILHNMKRKQYTDNSLLSWKLLREILMILAQKSDLV